MIGEITFHNRQRRRRIDTRRLKQRFQSFLKFWPVPHDGYNLDVYFISEKQSACLNQQWLNHTGPADVITFNYNDPGDYRILRGEIFVCVEQAVVQSREFKKTWPEELIRYVIHGILHLSGFDDLNSRARRKMKRHENALVDRYNRRF